MEAIVLAGGFGTRLREVVPDVPKPMAPVAGRPFLEILLQHLSAVGFKRVILSLGHKAEAIYSHFGASFAELEIEYVIEEVALGTGGAVRLALERAHNDHVFIFNGDTLIDLDAHEVDSMWRMQRRTIIVGCNVPDTTRYGRLLVSSGTVTGFLEKGGGGHGVINAGCNIMGVDQLDAWPVGVPFSLETDYLAPAVGRREVAFFETDGLFIDIGIPDDFVRAQTLLAHYK